MTLDAKRGTCVRADRFRGFDFYGGNRLGDDLFANCLIALERGNRQTDLAFSGRAARYLGSRLPLAAGPGHASSATGKKSTPSPRPPTGFVYLFDRSNGQTAVSDRYRKYPAERRPRRGRGREQPLPTKPAPFARQRLTEDLLTNRTPEAHRWAVEQFRKFRSDGQFVPFTRGPGDGVFPGFDGGAEWGGSAARSRQPESSM